MKELNMNRQKAIDMIGQKSTDMNGQKLKDATGQKSMDVNEQHYGSTITTLHQLAISILLILRTSIASSKSNRILKTANFNITTTTTTTTTTSTTIAMTATTTAATTITNTKTANTWSMLNTTVANLITFKLCCHASIRCTYEE